MKNKAVGYIRVSTKEQSKKGISLDAQRRAIKRYCTAHGLKLVKTYSDKKSGKDTNRPGFQEMMKSISACGANYIITYRHDRLFRDAGKALMMGQELGRIGIRIISTSESSTNDWEENPEGLLPYGLTALVNQHNREVISKRTKDALQFLRDNDRVYGPIPFGMMAATDGKGIRYLFPSPEEQETIRIMAELKRTMSYHKVARTLNERGLGPRPKIRNGQHTQGKWTATGIINTLRRLNKQEEEGCQIHHRSIPAGHFAWDYAQQ